ncbi:MAG: hypothetical protein ABSC17_09650 [Thermacetogeniaceae bacterium]
MISEEDLVKISAEEKEKFRNMISGSDVELLVTVFGVGFATAIDRIERIEQLQAVS